MIEAQNGMHVRSHDSSFLTRLSRWGLVDNLGWLLPLGFQYAYFKRNNLAYTLWERSLRAAAGQVPMPVGPAGRPKKPLELAADLVVVGGGPAGVGATAAAAEQGLKVALITRRWRLGRLSPRAGTDDNQIVGVQEVAGSLETSQAVTMVSPATAIMQDRGRLVVAAAESLLLVTAPYSILATGAYEQGLVFENNDLPGVMLAGAVHRLWAQDGVLAGKRAVVATSEPAEARRAVAIVNNAGIEVVALIICGAIPDKLDAGRSTLPGFPVVSGRILLAHGRRRVEGVTVEVAGVSKRVDCDLVCVNGGWQPADELASIATSRGQSIIECDRAQPRDWSAPGTHEDPVLQGVGALVGTRSTLLAFTEGRLAGLHVARAGGRDCSTLIAEAIERWNIAATQQKQPD